MPRRSILAEEQYADLILNTPHLVAYWPLYEFSGTVARNLSPKSPVGTYTGGFTLGKKGSGQADSSVLVNGTTGYVTIPNDADLHTNGAQSCEIWANFADVSSGWRPLMGIDADTANTGWVFNYRTEVHRLCWSKPSQTGDLGYDFTFTLGRWYHLVATYDGTSARLYTDGVLRSTVATPAPATNTVTMYLGARHNPTGTAPADFFSGNLARAAYYNGRILTIREIRDHYEAGIA